MRTLSVMTNRIVLSALLAVLALAACRDPNATADSDPIDLQSPEPPPVANGIGTSPSSCVDACDPEDLAASARRAPEPSVAPPSCGVWFDTSTAAADLRALACLPPQATVHTDGHATCADALALASVHGWTLSVVRRLAYNGVAIEADCP